MHQIPHGFDCNRNGASGSKGMRPRASGRPDVQNSGMFPRRNSSSGQSLDPTTIEFVGLNRAWNESSPEVPLIRPLLTSIVLITMPFCRTKSTSWFPSRHQAGVFEQVQVMGYRGRVPRIVELPMSLRYETSCAE